MSDQTIRPPQDEPPRIYVTVHSEDEELQAIEVLNSILPSFDAETTARILRYAVDRWGKP